MFGENLRCFRLKKDLTLQELAEKTGIDVADLKEYEAGSRIPEIETIQTLADVLGVKVSDFLTRRNKDLRFEHGEFH